MTDFKAFKVLVLESRFFFVVVVSSSWKTLK